MSFAAARLVAAACLLLAAAMASAEPRDGGPEPLTLDIRPLPHGEEHGLALMDEGRFTVANDLWTLAVALDLQGFRKTVTKLQNNAISLKALASNLTALGSQSAAEAPTAEADFASTMGSLLDGEVTGIREDLMTASRTLRELELATAPGPAGDAPTATTPAASEAAAAPHSSNATTPPGRLARVRRAWIDGGGAALRTVFGVATQRDLGRLQTQLAALQVGKKQVSHILEAQASLLNTTFQDQLITNKAIARLDETNKLLITEVQSLQEQTATLQDHQPAYTALDARLRLLHAALGRLRAELSRFLVGWTAASQHTLSPALLNPKDYFIALQGIQNSLQGGRTLLHPVDLDHIAAHYAGVKVTTVKIPRGILLYVDLPVTHPGLVFSLFQAVPLPVRTAETGVYARIIPPFPFLAVSLDHNLFVELDHEDRRACHEGGVRTCSPLRPLRATGEATTRDCLLGLYMGDTDKTQGCEVAVSRLPAPTFYRASGSTTWLFSVATAAIVQAHCTADPRRTPLPQRITGIGTLSVPAGCSATVQGITLSAPAHFASAYTAGGSLQPFTMPRLPTPTLATWTVPVTAADGPRLRDRVEALLNKTTGADVAAAGTALRLAALRQRIEDFKRDDEQDVERVVHLATTAGTSTLLLAAAAAVLFYCCCCRGGMIPCFPAATPQWTPLPSAAPFSPAPPRGAYAPQQNSFEMTAPGAPRVFA